MLFSSSVFLFLFLPAVWILYLLIPSKFLNVRNGLLAAASLFFYAFGEPVYILLMLFWGTLDLTGTLILAGLLVGQCVCVAVTRNNSAIHDLLAGTAVVDMASQTIFRSTGELIDYQKKLAAERAARQTY